MNIVSDSYLFLSKFIEGIEIFIILLLDEGSSDLLNKNDITSYSPNSFKMTI
jgi:hypothetical protein